MFINLKTSLEKSEYRIHIVGAGVSGLIAARVLEQNGYAPILLEATPTIGGRLKTDSYQGLPLDYGFQVVLSAYPMVQKYLDLEALEPCYFDSGAVIHIDGRVTRIGDPLRNPYLFFPTLFNNVATLADKIKIFGLQRALKRKSIEDIFETPEQTTLQYLQGKGFSGKVIRQFFLPFFSGIFLEHELKTSSRMFEFVYKMFGEGKAFIPKKGIGAIPTYLKNGLKETKICLNTQVTLVKDNHITLRDGSKLNSHFTIIATDPNRLVANLRNQKIAWKRCDTLYFKVSKLNSTNKLIRLVADKDALVNNVVLVSNLLGGPTKDEVISVTIVKPHTYSKKRLIEKVSEELQQLFQFESLDFIEHFAVNKALPDISNLKNDLTPEETRLTTRIFLAGDTLLNGSLNAAMLSGERAAQGVIHLLEESPDLAQFTSEYL
ncbi:MAG: FAD-dependent oxidoreductase [Bacteroidota bacterium]